MNRFKSLLSLLFLVSMFSVTTGIYAGEKDTSSGQIAGQMTKSCVTDIQTTKSASGIIDSSHNGLLIFDLYAPWCGPCRMLAPVLESLAGEYSSMASFYRVNVDALPEVAKAFGVSGIPYVVFVKNGVAVASLIGYHQRSEYEEIITTCINGKQSTAGKF